LAAGRCRNRWRERVSAHEVKPKENRATHGEEYTPPFKGNPADRIEA
jgi:hypothetical protein